MLRRILAVLFCALTVLALAACGSRSATSETKKEDATEQAVSYYDVKAGGLTLRCPSSWEDTVTVVADDTKAAFSLANKPVFDLYFGGKDGDVFGTVKQDEYIVIRVKFYDADTPEAEQMQGELGVISRNLKEDYDFVPGEAITKEDDATFEIKTDVVTLYYPKKWQEKVKVNVDGTTVSFAYNKEKLFDIVFEETDKGDLLGHYQDTPVSVVTYTVKSDEAIEMQEDMNVIYLNLLKDEHFSDD